MKEHIAHLIQQALDELVGLSTLNADTTATIKIDRTRDKQHGDFACNIAMMLAKSAGCHPRELAQKILDHLPASVEISKTEIAGPGFINFFLSTGSLQQVIGDVLDKAEIYGRSDLGKGQSVQVEFVSANPTGPLHVGHGRGAAYGASVADLLEAVGFKVHREYYVNDAGRQMDILAVSVWLRYLELCGEEIRFPVNAYKGDYIWDIAATLHRQNHDKLRHSEQNVFKGVPDDEPCGGNKEKHIDALIERARELLGNEDYSLVFDLGLDTILAEIKRDLEEFGVVYQGWYSERSLTRSGAVDNAIERLKLSGHVYEKNGALWFSSTHFGDEKDRVVVRDNGQATYFASDIAYHAEKIERGFDKLIDIWGADHHGYVARVRAAIKALGDDDSQLNILLVQFAILYRDGEKAPMSTRSGEFVTLRELRNEVGNDAARFFYVMRKCEQHMDFDLDLAKSQSSDNPVYYIQYAHARVRSVQRQLQEKKLPRDIDRGQANVSLLTESHEQDLMMLLTKYTETLTRSAIQHEPHQLAHYLRELANGVHTYYNAHVFLVDDDNLRDARLNLIEAARQVLANGLILLGVSAPESM